MHIAFLTLFLGLVSGPAPVEVTANGTVAAIELTLDGAPIARLAGPPFKGRIDFGKTLVPHLLVARGVDESGAELGRAEQWINVPRPPAEVEAIPELGGQGQVSAVRLAFQNLLKENPARVSAQFDGDPLPIAAQRVALPAYSTDTGHLLSIEVDYPSGLTARRDLAFGFGGEVATDLTALPVRLRSGAKLPAEPAALQGWFREGDQALRPVAVEDGPAELLVVRAPGTPPLLEQVGLQHLRLQHVQTFGGEATIRLRPYMTLGPEDRIRFMHPTAERFAGSGLPSALFPSSQSFSAQDGGIFWLLTRVLHPQTGTPRLADAVAVAGIQALTANHRRAVLLVLDRRSPADASLYSPEGVRQYLAAIHVPLYVWGVGGSSKERAAPSGWGKIEDVSIYARLQEAWERLAADLAAQRIVWLDGRHLPQAIALSTEAAQKVELAAPSR
jgi:hypothetical protein